MGQAKMVLIPPAGRSSNGKTAASGAAYRGSNPCLPAKIKMVRERQVQVHGIIAPYWRKRGVSGGFFVLCGSIRAA
jgi:hypothetical protein